MQTLQQAASDAANLSDALARASEIASTIEALGVGVKDWRVNGRRVVIVLHRRPPVAVVSSIF